MPPGGHVRRLGDKSGGIVAFPGTAGASAPGRASAEPGKAPAPAASARTAAPAETDGPAGTAAPAEIEIGELKAPHHADRHVPDPHPHQQEEHSVGGQYRNRITQGK